MEAPSPRERQVLLFIQRHIVEHKTFPTTDWLVEAFLREVLLQTATDIDETVHDAAWIERERKNAQKNILTIIGRLEKEDKEYIYRVGNTVCFKQPAVNEYFASLYESVAVTDVHTVIPAQMSVKGYVNAGPGHDLDIGFPAEAIENLPIPNIRLGSTVFALKVNGSSMETEGILDGDYVIVEELIGSTGPRAEDIVVAKYLEFSDKLKNFPDSDAIDHVLVGYTLKRFLEVVVEGKTRYMRLSRLQDAKNPYRIEAAHVEFVGRLIGLYRKYPRPLQNKRSQ